MESLWSISAGVDNHEEDAQGGGMVPSLKVLDPGHAFLCVAHHLGEEVGEAGAAELGGPCAVQVAVVDAFAVGGAAQAGGAGLGSGAGGRCLRGGGGRGKCLRSGA